MKHYHTVRKRSISGYKLHYINSKDFRPYTLHTSQANRRSIRFLLYIHNFSEVELEPND